MRTKRITHLHQPPERVEVGPAPLFLLVVLTLAACAVGVWWAVTAVTA